MCVRVRPHYAGCGHAADPTFSKRGMAQGNGAPMKSRRTLCWWSFCPDAIQQADAEHNNSDIKPCTEGLSVEPLKTALQGYCPTCTFHPSTMRTAERERFEQDRPNPKLAIVMQGPHKLVRRTVGNVTRFFIVPVKPPLHPAIAQAPLSDIASYASNLNSDPPVQAHPGQLPASTNDAKRLVLSLKLRTTESPQQQTSRLVRQRHTDLTEELDNDADDEQDSEMQSDSDDDVIGTFSGLRCRDGQF